MKSNSILLLVISWHFGCRRLLKGTIYFVYSHWVIPGDTHLVTVRRLCFYSTPLCYCDKTSVRQFIPGLFSCWPKCRIRLAVTLLLTFTDNIISKRLENSENNLGINRLFYNFPRFIKIVLIIFIPKRGIFNITTI